MEKINKLKKEIESDTKKLNNLKEILKNKQKQLKDLEQQQILNKINILTSKGINLDEVIDAIKNKDTQKLIEFMEVENNGTNN